MNSRIPKDFQALAEELLRGRTGPTRSPEDVQRRYERATELGRQIADFCLSSEAEPAEKMLGLATAAAVLSVAMSRPETQELLLESIFSYARNVSERIKSV